MELKAHRLAGNHEEGTAELWLGAMPAHVDQWNGLQDNQFKTVLTLDTPKMFSIYKLALELADSSHFDGTIKGLELGKRKADWVKAFKAATAALKRGRVYIMSDYPTGKQGVAFIAAFEEWAKAQNKKVLP